MSRHGFSDDCDDILASGRWQGAMLASLRGKRGQAFLRELRDALDAMTVKELVSHELVTEDGGCCAMGCIAKARGLDVKDVDPEDPNQVASLLGINERVARTIAYENDDGMWRVTDAERWAYMRKWVERNIKQEATPA